MTGVGVLQNPVPTSVWLKYDKLFDDGTLTTGKLQVRADVFIRQFANTLITAEAVEIEGAVEIIDP